MSSEFIGLDLGGAVCRVAHLVPSRRMPVIVRNALSNESTPTIASFAPGEQRQFGEAAMGREMSQPRATVRDLRQALLAVGAPASRARVIADMKRGGTPAVEHSAAPIAFDFPSNAEDAEPVALQQVLGFVLGQLMSYVPRAAEGVRRTLTVALPLGAGADAIQAVHDAVLISGEDVATQVVSDAEAAALYMHHLHFARLPSDATAEPTRAVIVSVGETSCFAAAVELHQHSVRVVAASALAHTGTSAIDAALMTHAAAVISAKHKVDITDHAKSVNKVLRECRKGKTMLSTTDSYVMQFESLKDGIDASVPITREQLEGFATTALLSPLEQMLKEVRSVLESTGTADKFEVQVIGNGWRAPCVQAMIKSALNVSAIGQALDANMAIAEGASIAGAIKAASAAAATAAPAAASEGDAAAAAPVSSPTSPQGDAFDAIHTVAISADCAALPPASPAAEESQQTVLAWVAAEKAAAAADSAIQAVLNAKNELESCVLQHTEIADALEDIAADAKAELVRVLRAEDDWVRDFGDEADKATLEARLAALQTLITDKFPQVEAYRVKQAAEQRAKDEELERLAQTRAEAKELKSDPQRLRAAQERREQGANLFKQEHFEEAVTRFVQGVAILAEIYDTKNEETMKQKNTILLSCYLNIASCSVKLQKWRNAVNNATSALELDEGNAKALFRRGQAYNGMNEFPAAKRDLERALELSGGDAGVKAELDFMLQKEAAQTAKEKKMYAKMFA
jgi:molecular chaperone DnaK (HSP70)